jgi:hypothetical protein
MTAHTPIARQRPPQRVPGGLNRPAMVTVAARDWDEQRLELAAHEHDALAFIVEARLLLAGIETTVAHTDPYALQRVVGLRRRLARYEETWR